MVKHFNVNRETDKTQITVEKKEDEETLKHGDTYFWFQAWTKWIKTK